MQRWPDRELLFPDSPSSFALLARDSLRTSDICTFVDRSAAIFQKSGIKPHDRIGIVKSNHVDIVLLSIAIMRAGCIAVPVNEGFSTQALEDYARYTGLRAIITDAHVFRRLKLHTAAFPSVDLWLFPDVPDEFAACTLGRAIDLNIELASTESKPAPTPEDPERIVMICHTSGTTGTPKGVKSTNRGLVSSARLMAMLSPATRRTRSATAFAFNHKIAHDTLFGVIASGFPLWPTTRHQPDQLLAWLQNRQINVFSAFPDKLLSLYDHGLDRYDLSAMRIWLSAGDASHEAHMQNFVGNSGKSGKGARYIETMGTSEIGTVASARIFSRRSPITGSRLIGRRVFGGPEIKIADKDGNRVPPGHVGRFMVRGASVFQGYWCDDTKTLDTRHRGWWWTGDLAMRDRGGRLYHFDREADAIETPTGVVFSLLIEEKILFHPDIAEAVVVAERVPDGAPAIVAVCSLKTGRSAKPEAIKEWVNRSLGGYAKVERIILVPMAKIPRGLTGKVLKRELRQQLIESSNRA
ncbi:MAG: class I adenylate-forming enzyme family protein [Novosphingobium sp.]